jgi:hypothetical protein
MREQTRSRYARRSAKLPRIGEGAESVLQSMQGLRQGLHRDDDEAEE